MNELTYTWSLYFPVEPLEKCTTFKDIFPAICNIPLTGNTSLGFSLHTIVHRMHQSVQRLSKIKSAAVDWQRCRCWAVVCRDTPLPEQHGGFVQTTKTRSGFTDMNYITSPIVVIFVIKVHQQQFLPFLSKVTCLTLRNMVNALSKNVNKQCQQQVCVSVICCFAANY